MRRLAHRWDAWTAAIAASEAYIAVLTAVVGILSVIQEMPEGFSATLLWEFRIASPGMHAILWTVIGLLFGYLADGAPRPFKAAWPT